MATLRAAVPAALAALIGLSACGNRNQDEDQWAREALARNATLEVVSSERVSGTVTVRIKSTGELRTVRASELIAALPPDAARAAEHATPATPAAAPPGPAVSASEPAPSMSEPAPPASEPPPPASADEPTPSEPIPPALVQRTQTPSGRVIASGPGYSISDAGSAPKLAASAKVGDTLVSGPGYSIRAAGPGALGGSPSSTASTPVDSPVGNVALEEHHEPMTCQGNRLLRIDGRNIEFDGDALSAQDGCDLQITNSRIVAQGIAVAAHNASVRIENSLIDGGPRGAIVATDGAQVYAQQSIFKGVIRHADSAAFHDLGGNVGN
jgi:hypothetical protein